MSLPSNAFTTIVHPEVIAYLRELQGADDPLLDRLEAYGQACRFPIIGRESGRFLELLSRSIGARRVFEMGSGFGFSAFFFARAVGETGRVLGSELDPALLETHRAMFAGHALAPRVDLRPGDAFALLDEVQGELDVVFVDIEKVDYARALAVAVPRLRPGGLLLVDNALWGGRAARPAPADDLDTRGIQDFNRAFFADERLLASIIPVRDGLAVGLKL